MDVGCNKCGATPSVMYQYGPGRHLCPGCAGGDAEGAQHDRDTVPVNCGDGCTPGDHLDGCVNAPALACGDFKAGLGSPRAQEICSFCGWTRAFHDNEMPPILSAALPEPGPRPDVTPPESDARRVIRERCADWSRRSDKWHGILDLARRWVAFGDKAPTVIGAIVACLAWQYPGHYAGAFPLAGAVVCALVGWRARAARGDLDDAHTEQCWLIADRMSEFYRGLIAQFGSADDQILLSKSQIVEATARIGLPDNVRDAIACVVKVS